MVLFYLYFFKSFVFLSCSFSSSASVWYFFVCNILILIVWVWACVFSWENDQKLDKNRRVFCMLVNVWFCSVHITDIPRVYVVFYCCESVLVCVRVRIFMYSLAGNSARVRISLFTLSIRFSVLEKKEKFTSIKFQVWFWRSQFYSKVVLVIRFSLTFFSLCHSCCQFAVSATHAVLQAVLPVVWGGEICCQNFGLLGRTESKYFRKRKSAFLSKTLDDDCH